MEVKETKKEAEKTKLDLESQLAALNQKYTATKGENETLRIRNDVLFKLGKSYLDKYEKPVVIPDKPVPVPRPDPPQVDAIQVVANIENTDNFTGV